MAGPLNRWRYNQVCQQTSARITHDKDTSRSSTIHCQFDTKFLHWMRSCSSRVGATSMMDLEWQLTRLGSAPWASSNEHTSTRDFEAASCRGVNCHRSTALTLAPACKVHVVEPGVLVSLSHASLYYDTIYHNFCLQISMHSCVHIINRDAPTPPTPRHPQPHPPLPPPHPPPGILCIYNRVNCLSYKGALPNKHRQ